MLFRILKFKPGTGEEAAAEAPSRARAPVRRTCDNRFFFDGAKEASCSSSVLVVRGAAAPARADVRRAAVARVGHASRRAGKGTVYSFVINHYPQVPAFDYPLTSALIELEEGTRLVANLVGIDRPTTSRSACRSRSSSRPDDELTLPQFRPVEA